MIEFLGIVIESFGKYVTMLFELPFYGTVSWGIMLLSLYIFAVILGYLGSRYK